MPVKLVVGLGNPGRQYEGTRHNVGFEVLNRLALKYALGKRKRDFQAEVVEAKLNETKLLLVWPQTYMNLSGGSVLAARDFYKIPDDDVLVVCDDFNLPLGKLRIRPVGSSGGQKGLENILNRLGTQQIARLRLGVGTPGGDAVNFVLSKFRKEELSEIQISIEHAMDAIGCWALQGTESCMNKYN